MRHHFEKIKSEGTCLHRLDEELIKRRREELRLVYSSETILKHKEIKMMTIGFFLEWLHDLDKMEKKN